MPWFCCSLQVNRWNCTAGSASPSHSLCTSSGWKQPLSKDHGVTLGINVQHIPFDRNYWEKVLLPKLVEFYDNYFGPEIVSLVNRLLIGNHITNFANPLIPLTFPLTRIDSHARLEGGLSWGWQQPHPLVMTPADCMSPSCDPGDRTWAREAPALPCGWGSLCLLHMGVPVWVSHKSYPLDPNTSRPYWKNPTRFTPVPHAPYNKWEGTGRDRLCAAKHSEQLGFSRQCSLKHPD